MREEIEGSRAEAKQGDDDQFPVSPGTQQAMLQVKSPLGSNELNSLTPKDLNAELEQAAAHQPGKRPSATAARKEWEESERQRKAGVQQEAHKQAKIQRELNKEVRDLKQPHTIYNFDSSDEDRTSRPSRITFKFSKSDASGSEEEDTMVLFSHTNWKEMATRVWAVVERLYHGQNKLDTVAWHSSVPALMKVAVPGLGYYEFDIQEEFIAYVHALEQELAEQEDPARSTHRLSWAIGLVARLEQAGDARPDSETFQDETRFRVAASLRADIYSPPTSEEQRMCPKPDAWTQLVAIKRSVRSAFAIDKHEKNREVLLAAVHAAQTLAWDAQDAWNWWYVLAEMPAFMDNGPIRDMVRDTNFRDTELAALLRTEIGDKICVLVTESTPPDPNEEMGPEQLKAAIAQGDLFGLTNASKYFQQLHATTPADMMMYSCTAKMSIEECVHQYRAFHLETANQDFGQDLLSMKVNKPARMFSMSHYIYILVRVEPLEVLLAYDSLSGRPVVDLSTPSYLASKRDETVVVTEMYGIKPSALIPGLDLPAALKKCAESSLAWKECSLPIAIPPMTRKAKVPSCTFDVCTMEAFVLARVCLVHPTRFPDSLTLSRWRKDQSLDSDDPEVPAGWLEHVRDELIIAMTVCRAKSLAGLQWPGSEDDQSIGLNMDDVACFVRDLTGGRYTELTGADTPSQFLEASRKKMNPEKAKAVRDAERAEAVNTVDEKKRQAGASHDKLVRRAVSKENAVASRREALIQFLKVTVPLVVSGRRDLTEEQWRDELARQYPGQNVQEIMDRLTLAGVEEGAKIMWFDDLSFEHPGLKTRVTLIGTRLAPAHMRNKDAYDALPILERPTGIVPIFQRLGRAVHVAVSESFPLGTQKGEEDQHLEEREAIVLMPFMQLVTFNQRMAGLTWDQVQESFPEVHESRTFALQLLQMRSDGSLEPPLSMQTPFRGGCVQVVCVQYHPANGLEPPTIEYFTERLDEIQNGWFVDPFHRGQISVGRSATSLPPSYQPQVLTWCSPWDVEYKLRAALKALVDASKEDKHVGEFIKGGFVRSNNFKTSAPGKLP